MPYIGKSPGKLGVRTRFYYTATGGETSKSGADDNGLTLKFDDGEYVDVYLNGVLLVAGTDYNTSTANTISGLTALVASDILEVIVYDIYSLAKTNSEAQRTKYYVTATGGETSISGTDDNGATITFSAGAQIDVHLNGVSLKQGDDYNTTVANTVGGLAALTAGQLVEIVVYEKFVLADMVKKSGDTMTGSLTAPSIITTSNVDVGGSLLVDTINEKTTGNGVYIPGHVIQVVSQNFSTGASTTTFGTFVATGKSVSITPTSASSKILLLGSIPIHASGISSGAHAIFSIFRGGVASGTNLGNANFGLGQVYSTSGDNIAMLSLNYIDTPATTSSVTYEIGITKRNPGITQTNLCVNNEHYNITLMEIAQ